ncbi:hypothetical protein FYZ48_12330 [Gimesia chilikensis]|uniref:hypothetical protein n=1 Tax=Gimesia chilikensis TaxID=2605989 RepID=UPI0011F05A4D|nr:hypothetical protein [Gimesia chilikensis]KAA0138275.1 hypothetical protein FYZ48_12330 [Gimesia chilikensis]
MPLIFDSQAVENLIQAAMYRPERQTLIMKSFPLLLLMPLLLLPIGCGKQDEIHTYEVPKEGTDLGPAQATPAEAKPTRMLAAILPGVGRNWFFKMTGTPEQVAAQFDTFIEFLKSVTLKAGQPEWKLPADWTQEPGSSMRFATLKVKDTDPPLEMSVIPLPPSGTLENVNRWRDQVGLAPITEKDLTAAEGVSPGLDQEQFTLKTGDKTITVVSLDGKMADNPMSRAPFASGMMGGGMPAPGGPAASTPPAAAAQIKYETPSGWKPGRSGGMRKAAFNVSADGETGEVTVIDLAKDSSPLLPNINRWRDQVKLKAITDADLSGNSEQLKAGDLEATYVKLIGPEGETPRPAILGAIIYRDNLAWFVKFTGPAKLAEKEEANFKEFVKSIRFE